MKTRNFVNKLLLIGMMLLYVLASWTVPTQALVFALQPAEEVSAIVPLTKTYTLDNFNYNQPTQESIYQALGIVDYNEYLMELSQTQSLNEVVVAVIDTGVSDDHPLFKDRLLSEYGMDFSQGLPTAVTNTWYTDENGHGTHVAGVIADITLSNVKILPIRIFHGINNQMDTMAFVNALMYLRALKTGTSTRLYRAVGGDTFQESEEYYNTEKVKLDNLCVANFSLGSDGFAVDKLTNEYKTERDLYQNLVDYCLLQVGILPIMAAGNRSDSEINDQAYYSLPGACSGVLSVSWYDNKAEEYALAQKSYFNDNVSVAGPGSEIWSACSSDIRTYYSPETERDGYIFYKNRRNEVQDVVRAPNGTFYFRSSGTSMATPFVTACYAMLMSDSSKNTVADYGLTRFDASAKGSDDNQYVSVAHKALLSAAATNGYGLATEEERGYSVYFGYGTIDVSVFVPENDAVATLDDIKYEPLLNTTKASAKLPNLVKYVSSETPGETNWFHVCVILGAVGLGVLGIKMFAGYVNSTRRKDTNGDNQ